MIARIWTAHTTPELADSYLQHFESAVRPELRKISGFLGATVGLRPSPGRIEIIVITYWQSFEAIDTFAGTDRDQAIVTSDAAALLTEYDRRVRHYEIALKEFPPDA